MKLYALLILTLSLFGQQPDSQLAAARVAEQSGNLAGAERHYVDSLKANPNADTFQRLGLVRHLQNKFEEAIAAFQSSIKLDHSLWAAHLFLGIDLYRTNRFDLAFAELTEADHLEHDNQEIQFWLGVTELARKRYFPGLAILEKLRRQQPDNLEVLKTLAETYATIGTAMLNNVAEKFPDSAAGMTVHAQALESEGAYAQALTIYRKIEKAWPGRTLAKKDAERLEAIVSALPPPAAPASFEASPIPP